MKYKLKRLEVTHRFLKDCWRLLQPRERESGDEHPPRVTCTLGARHQVLSGCLWLGRALLGTLLSPEGDVTAYEWSG